MLKIWAKNLLRWWRYAFLSNQATMRGLSPLKFRSPDWFVLAIRRSRFLQVVRGVSRLEKPHAQSLFLFPIAFGLWANTKKRNQILFSFSSDKFWHASNFRVRQRDCESASGPRLMREILWLMKKPQTPIGKRSRVVACMRLVRWWWVYRTCLWFFQPQYLADQVWTSRGPPAVSQSCCLKSDASCCISRARVEMQQRQTMVSVVVALARTGPFEGMLAR